MPYTVLDPATAEPAVNLAVGAPLVSRGETLLSFQQELFYQLGGRDDIDPARLVRWINFGYIDLATSLKIDELKSSYALNAVADQPLYRVPLQVFSSIEFSIVDEGNYQGGFPMHKTDLSSYRKAQVASGVPEYYFRHGDLFVLWPSPSAAYTIGVDFWLRPDFMTEDDHSPLLQIEWHEALLLAAKEKAFDGLMEPQMALAVRNQWISLVRRKRDRGADEDEGRLATFSPVNSAQDVRSGRLSSHYEPE